MPGYAHLKTSGANETNYYIDSKGIWENKQKTPYYHLTGGSEFSYRAGYQVGDISMMHDRPIFAAGLAIGMQGADAKNLRVRNQVGARGVVTFDTYAVDMKSHKIVAYRGWKTSYTEIDKNVQDKKQTFKPDVGGYWANDPFNQRFGFYAWDVNQTVLTAQNEVLRRDFGFIINK